MKSLYPLAVLAALAACKPAPQVVDSRAPDPNAAALANAAPVELPPAIRAQKTYRCKDNSLAFVSWFVGDKTANVRLKENDPPKVLNSDTGGSPWASADGWKLSGDDQDIKLTPAGKSQLTCHT